MTFKKTMLRAALAALLLSSGSALAASADFTSDVSLALEFVPVSETETVTDTIAYGGTRDVLATITVPAGTAALGMTVSAVIPAGLKVASVADCTPTGTTAFPCTVADVVDGGTRKVTVTLSQAMPSPLPTTCGETATYTDFSMTVTTESTDPDTANNTAAVTPVGVPLVFADLAVTFTGPEVAGENQDVEYTVTVTNNGPCVSEDVWVLSKAYGSAPFVSATWTCLNTPEEGATFEDVGCQLGNIDVGAANAKTFKKTYHIPSMPSDANSLYHPNGVALGRRVADPAPDAAPNAVVSASLKTKDLKTSNNTSTLDTWVHQKGSGCSTSGAGGPTGLLALGALGLLFRRRRS